MRDPRLWFLTAGGLGLMRPAPGTWGSLPPVVMAGGLALLGVNGWMLDASLILLCLVGGIACVRFGHLAEAAWGKKDPGQVVADEVAGQALTLLFLPWRRPDEDGAIAFNLALAAVGFLAFRAFDITKPPPARNLERIRGGWGILVDDLVAGAMALAVVQVVARFALGPVVQGLFGGS
ncbi:MAG: phosphatidylglycerophosphatase A family protein [Planctomycetota bacterium]|jgi:phosphatidylglycerophosphatase A